MVPSRFTPVFMVMIWGWRERAAKNSSSRLYSSFTGRPVAMVRWQQMSSISTSCLPPKPPPMRGLITRMRFSGRPMTGAIIRRTWKGTWVLVRTTMRPSSSHQETQMCGSMLTWCCFCTSYVPSMIRSDAAKPWSTSPTSACNWAARLRLKS